MKSRVYGLDYLRGLSALLIAIYHLLKWEKFPLSNEGLISKFGIYGVAIFFVLSGYAMHHVYEKLSFDVKTIKNFYKKRVIRIFPLFWFVTIVTLIFTKKDFSFFEISINFAGVFSLIQPASYIAGGSWSIGIELVFYLIFPLLILSFKKGWSTVLVYSVFLMFFIYFAFVVIDTKKKLLFNWPNYVNPLNQLIFFYSGMALSRFNIYIKKFNLLLLLLVLFLITMHDVQFFKSEIIGGFDRLFYYLYCIFIVVLFVKIDFNNKKYIHKSLVFLGDVSYSFYLIHPLVYSVVDKINDKYMLSNNIFIAIVIKLTITLIISFISYNIIELKGKKMLNNFLSFEK